MWNLFYSFLIWKSCMPWLCSCSFRKVFLWLELNLKLRCWWMEILKGIFLRFWFLVLLVFFLFSLIAWGFWVSDNVETRARELFRFFWSEGLTRNIWAFGSLMLFNVGGQMLLFWLFMDYFQSYPTKNSIY